MRNQLSYFATIALGLIALRTSPLPGQRVAPGSAPVTIRILGATPDLQVTTGTLEAYSLDTLLFRPVGTSNAVSVPLRGTARVQMETKTTEPHPYVGLILGTVLGATVGKGQGVSLGAGIGLLAGSFLRSSTTAWQPLPIRNERVRVLSPGMKPKIGSIAEIRADSIFIRVEGSRDLVAFGRTAGTQLQVTDGDRSNLGPHFRNGLLIGTVGGAIAGAASFDGDTHCFFCPRSAGDAAMFGALVGGMTGGFLGLLSGAFTKSPHWVPAPLDGLRLSLAPVSSEGRKGFSFSMSRPLQF